jgi:hypothetical protein
MKKHINLISSSAWMVVAGIFCLGGIRLGLGSYDEPGPGFFPFLMSVFLFSFSLILFISSLKKVKQLNVIVSSRFWPESDGIKRILFVVVSLFMYVFVLNYLGFVLTTFFFMFFLLRVIHPHKWITVFLGAGLTAGLSYAIFELWLKAHLPVGPLGF